VTGTIAAGTHRIVVESDEDRREREVTVEYAEPVELDIALRSGKGTLVVVGNPPLAIVSIDGDRAGPLPFAASVAPGKHHVVVSADGYTAFETDATIEPNTPHKIEVHLESEPQSEYGGYFVAGVGGASVRGDGALLGLEVGFRSSKHELLAPAGKLGDFSFAGFMYRYAFARGALSPYVGGGYLAVRGAGSDENSGLAAEAGVRWDFRRSPGLTMSLRATAGVYAFSAIDPGRT